jgi:hypothetical protein
VQCKPWSKDLRVTADGPGVVSHVGWICCGRSLLRWSAVMHPSQGHRLNDQLGDDWHGRRRAATDATGLLQQLSPDDVTGRSAVLVPWGSSVHYGSARSQAQLAFNGSISVRSDRY